MVDVFGSHDEFGQLQSILLPIYCTRYIALQADVLGLPWPLISDFLVFLSLHYMLPDARNSIAITVLRVYIE